ncbi:MAG: hypothetical protein Q8N99_02245 [Nanoarchaeota archaeon]|nr:hypothetical protein [Nanoarchaeota archaeon]
MVKKKLKKEKSVKIDLKKNMNDERTLFAWIATFLSIIGFVIALIVKRDDKYVMYYAKHSLIIFVIIFVLGGISGLLFFLPIIGEIINAAVVIISVILWVISWIFALSGEEKIIPIITDLTKKFEL